MSSSHSTASEAQIDSDIEETVNFVSGTNWVDASDYLELFAKVNTNVQTTDPPRPDTLRPDETNIDGKPPADNWNEVADKSSADDSSKSQIIKPNMVIYYVRQFFCLLIVIVTTYATYQNIPSKQLIAPEVRPFFPADSFVEDWPSGELFKAQGKVTLSELSFVLFYAPWSAESQHARISYEFAAKLFHKQAYFAAINCWHPVGECRQQYTKVMSWPVLMAYNQNGIAIPYSGQWSDQALTSFILTLLQPLKRIYQPEDLVDLMHNHDVVIVSYLDMSKHQAFYNIYLQTSIKWLERDPDRDVGFAVVTGDSRNVFDVGPEPSVRMYLWNDTLEYDSRTWKPSLLTQWMTTNMYTVSAWATPPGTKSSLLRPFVNKGPLLILFTPRNLYEEANDAYSMLRQIAFEYNNCMNDSWVKDLSRVYSHQRRQECQKNYETKKSDCEKRSPWEKNDFTECASVTKKTFVNLVNSSKFNYAEMRPKEQFCSLDVNNKEVQDACQVVPTVKSNYMHLESKGPLRDKKPLTSMLNSEYDEKSATNIKRIWDNLRCRINQFSQVIWSNMFYDSLIEKTSVAVHETFDLISGLGCKSNKTMSFLAMDSTKYEIFAERLGIDVQNLEKRTAAVILDSENESTYVLQESITTHNLIHFVHDFAANKLNRFLRSNANVSHSFLFDGFSHYDVIARKAEKIQHRKKSVPLSKEPKTISIMELSSDNFEKHVLETNQTVAVLFYSTQCALCTIFTNTLLYVANILSDLSNLKVVRIDSDKNDLAWQFTMESVPTFIIFNGHNKLESRKFPPTLQVTASNVIGFILANLDRPTRLHAMLIVLKQNKIVALDSGLAVFEREVTDNISLNLKNWRQQPHKRNIILRRIQALQQLYLKLFRIHTVSDLKVLDPLVRNILNIWTGDDK